MPLEVFACVVEGITALLVCTSIFLTSFPFSMNCTPAYLPFGIDTISGEANAAVSLFFAVAV